MLLAELVIRFRLRNLSLLFLRRQRTAEVSLYLPVNSFKKHSKISIKWYSANYFSRGRMFTRPRGRLRRRALFIRSKIEKDRRI